LHGAELAGGNEGAVDRGLVGTRTQRSGRDGAAGARDEEF
jgi:hypothetical protein